MTRPRAVETTLPKKDVVLLGVGHTNAHVLRMWRMRPFPETRLTCVSDFGHATYSGMLPGVLAGQYPPERMMIDLVRLCAAARARLVRAPVVGLDLEARRLLLADRPPLAFDALSIGIGSVPDMRGVPLADTVVPIKPMQTFLARFVARLEAAARARAGAALRIVVVGAGAGGVEITLCLPARVRAVLAATPIELSLVDGGEGILPGTVPAAQALARRELEARGVALRLGAEVVRVDPDAVTLADETTVAADVVLWATGAAPPPLLARLGLPTDDRGFLLTRATLRTTADAPIFAVGDTGTMVDQAVAKAGVYAVRQGPILWENLARTLDGRPLVPYEPQRGFLKLLNSGDGRAIGAYRGRAAHARWCWTLKNLIDGRFMDKHQDYRPMEMAAPAGAPAVMRCAGCGGKVGSSVLARVLARLDVPAAEHVLLGLEQPDDAAVLRLGADPVAVTTDFFTAPLDDPYTVGRLAALNAASDVFAVGATPRAALAMATIPVGDPRQQEELLYQLLAGGLRELHAMGATLVGGHTIEGPQLTVGFTLLAEQTAGPPRTKASLRAGDRLVLTKPLGSGVLLAAHMQARCRAEWMGELVRVMLESNALAARALDGVDVHGLTDVTGFGLAGHLLEMLRASDVAAEVALDTVPLLPGARALAAAGIESTLAPANRAAEAEVEATPDRRHAAGYPLLFDPQTSGGLLLGVAEAESGALLARLAAAGVTGAAAIGWVRPAAAGRPRVVLS